MVYDIFHANELDQFHGIEKPISFVKIQGSSQAGSDYGKTPVYF